MKVKRTWAEASALAQEFIQEIRPSCTRVEIAGSLRRCKPVVGDVEIVAIPRFRQRDCDLFGEPTGPEVSALDGTLARGEEYGTWKITAGTKNRGRERKMVKLEYKGMQFDMFLQPDPQTWGVNYMIRTGAAEFTAWMMTTRAKQGGKPNDLVLKEARIWRAQSPAAGGSYLLNTLSEHNVFREYGLPFLTPIARIKAYWGCQESLLEAAEDAVLSLAPDDRPILDHVIPSIVYDQTRYDGKRVYAAKTWEAAVVYCVQSMVP